MLMFTQGENQVKFISLASGSSGNCYFLSNGIVSILIDMGVGVRTLKKRLSEHSISLDSVDMVLVTHDHIDHIKHLGSFAERYFKPVYATSELHEALSNNFTTRGKIGAFKKVIEAEKETEYKGVKITAFPVPHDGTENFGYHIEISGKKITLITDVGRVTETVEKYAKMADHLIFESNYDSTMLNNGFYPKMLIDRISNGKGHLSNHESSEAIKKIYHPYMKSLFLCHLSANNNTPELAFNSAANALISLGVKPGEAINLVCLPRGSSSPLYIL